MADPCEYGGLLGCSTYSSTHFDRRRSKQPQTGQEWCWTTYEDWQARQT